MPAAWEYEQAVNNVSNWYNTSADNVWNVVNGYNLTPEQTQGLLPTVDSFLYGQGSNSGYTAVKAADGSVMSWNNVAGLQGNSANAVEQAVNSNAGAVTQQTYQLPANTDYSGTGGTFNATKGVTGGGGAIKVMSQVSAAVAAAGLGIKLGKAIDGALYNLNPDFWDNNGMATLNPETWNSITADMSNSGWEGNLKRAFNAIFGLDPNTGKSQMYLDADAAAYLAMYMNSKGVFASPENYYTIDDATKERLPYPNIPSKIYTIGGNTSFVLSSNRDITNPAYYLTYTITSDAQVGAIFIHSPHSGEARGTHVILASKNPFLVKVKYGQSEVGNSAVKTEVLGEEFYYLEAVGVTQRFYIVSMPAYNDYPDSGTAAQTYLRSVAYAILFGTEHKSGGVDGITNQESATQPDFTGCETPDDYRQALETQYPDMFQNAVTQNVAQPDGTVVQKVYVPVGTPSANGTQDSQPTTDPNQGGQSQDNTEVDPATTTQTIIDTVIKYIENTRTPDTPDTSNPPDTGDGNTPPVVTPTGQASSLFAIYNPTQAQLNSFGAWLWSADFVDQILKLFNDPMQSIIGLHKIFATPSISGSSTIHVGYLDSGVGSNTVGSQYTDVNCGSVKVSEQFGNAFDYTDTHVRLYLPFIGIVDLDTSDIMRGTISVVYHVDVITGACLAEVKVTRDGSGGTLYQYSGDAAVRYPISSGSYMGVVSGVLSAVGGIASAFMTGGATLPMAAGAVAGGMSQAKTQVQHSGNFSGCAGAMGAKKPYLIIERPQTMIADGFESYQGKGANARRTVGQMSGYFKFSDVHTDSINGASESEIEAIRAALESGVIA